MLDVHRRRTKEAHEVGQPFLKIFHKGGEAQGLSYLFAAG